ncbi:MAG: AAA family ATPase [Planctomycetes bacterium]|nr:AAA family ATPase [Planctomycetota bacterium]
MKPLLIVVTGRPGSGKTTLAHMIAQKVCCPAVSRDEIKEGFCITHNAEHTQLPSDTNKKLYDVYFTLVEEYLSQGISLVAEAAFQHTLWEPQLSRLDPICDIRIIRCTIDAQIARERAIERGLKNPRREKFHRDFAVHAAKEGIDLPIGTFHAIEYAAPTLDVATDGDYQPDLERMYEFTMANRMK